MPFWLNRTQPYYLQLTINVLIFAVLALSWDILARTGQLSLAHAAFFGLGAYTSALVTTRAGMPIPVGIALGSL
ncbi:MAG: ABC transporter permease subunit, partial [Burkholderiales bacterium]